MKKAVYLLGILVIVAIAYFVISSNEGQFTTDSGKLKVSTSFYPLYFITTEIAGDKAEVYNITPPGVEPHDYDLSPSDRVRIEDGDLLVLVGSNFEPWGSGIDDISANSKTRVLFLAEGEADPHFWLSPTLTKTKILEVAGELKMIDPEHASVYEQNAGSLIVKMDDLDKKMRDGLQNCKRNDFITSHAAFGYLARDYGLNQVSISGISPDEEPSAQDLVRIAKFAREKNVKYIFFESLVSPKLAETMATEVGARTLVLNPIEGLTRNDAAEGKNYFTEMENNLNNLKIALECE